MQYDSHGAYSTSTGAYVCNQSETLNVSGQLTTQGTFSINNFADVGLFKNGVQDKLARTYSGGSMSTVTTPFTFDIKCLAGDSITLRGQSNATSPSWVNDAAINWVQFKKIGNY